MNRNEYQQHLKEKIAELRKSHSLTQEQLAEKMGISYQAVSKWENGVACPDIMFLPKLSEIFGVTIDSLFFDVETTNDMDKISVQVEQSENKEMDQHKYIKELPWNNDKKLHVVVYEGHKLLRDYDSRTKEFEFKYEGDLRDLDSALSVNCGDVLGNLNVGDNVNCGDVQGNVIGGDSINCGDVWGNVTAGDEVNCGNVKGKLL